MNRPATFQSGVKSTRARIPYSTGDFIGTELLSFKLKENDTSSVLGRLESSYPSAVAGLVTFLVVDSVNHQSFRAFPHIGQEVPEVQPTIAHFNPAGSIQLEASTFGIPASLEDRSPARISSAGFAIRNMSMHPSTLAPRLPYHSHSFATATPAATVLNLRKSSDNQIAALAFELPSVAVAFDFPYRRQVAEHCAC